jgi:hypothetical protein
LSGASDLTTQTTQKKKLQIKKIQNKMKNEQQYETTKPNKKKPSFVSVSAALIVNLLSAISTQTPKIPFSDKHRKKQQQKT